jgi:hypothetical protein
MSSKSDEERMAALVRKNAAKAAKAKRTAERRYDPTLPPDSTTDADLERRDFFSEMKKRDF